MKPIAPAVSSVSAVSSASDERKLTGLQLTIKKFTGLTHCPTKPVVAKPVVAKPVVAKPIVAKKANQQNETMIVDEEKILNRILLQIEQLADLPNKKILLKRMLIHSTKVDLETNEVRNCNGDKKDKQDVSLIQRLHCLSKLGQQIAKIEN